MNTDMEEQDPRDKIIAELSVKNEQLRAVVIKNAALARDIRYLLETLGKKVDSLENTFFVS